MFDMEVSIALKEREATPSGQIDLGGRHNPVATDDTTFSCTSTSGCSEKRATTVATARSSGVTAGAARQAWPTLQSCFFEWSDVLLGEAGGWGQQACDPAETAWYGQARAAHALATPPDATENASNMVSQMRRMILYTAERVRSGQR